MGFRRSGFGFGAGLTVLVGLLGAQVAMAQAGTCIERVTKRLAVTTGLKTYVINGAGFNSDPNCVDPTDQICGVSASEGYHAAIMAADVWNEQGNAGTFRFVKTDSNLTAGDYYDDGDPDNGMPWTAAECAQRGLNHSLIEVVRGDSSTGAIRETGGNARAVCALATDPGDLPCDPNDSNASTIGCVGTQFIVQISAASERPKTASCGPVSCTACSLDSHCNTAIGELCNVDGWCKLHRVTPWTTGAVGANERDIASMLVHELGHTLNLSHGTNGEAGVQGDESLNTYWGNGMTAARDLYQFDLKCLSEESGTRQLTGRLRYQISSTSLGPEQAFSPANVAKVGAGYSWTPTDGFGAALLSGNSFLARWQYLLTSSGYWNALDNSQIDPRVGVGPTAAVLLDNDSAAQRIFYTSFRDYDSASGATTGYTDKESVHKVRYKWSNDRFKYSESQGSMYHCNGMSGWMTCDSSTTSLIVTGKPIGIGYIDGFDVTVFAWTHQNRLNDPDSGRVRVSIGVVNNTTVPDPIDIGVDSSVGPAIACHKDFSSGRDCVLAYVDRDDSLNRVKTVRFQVAQTSNAYSIATDFPPNYVASSNSLARSSSRIALWYVESSTYPRFWMAIRSHNSGTDQAISVWYSSNGQTWTKYSSNVGHSASGPTAVSILNEYQQGEPYNVLMYGR